MRRIMGTETEYGITGGHASDVVRAYHLKGKEHTNLDHTNKSAVEGLHDIGGHIGGDYGSLQDQLAEHGINHLSGTSGSLQERLAERGMEGVHDDFHEIHNVHVRGVTYDLPDHAMPNGARFYVDMGHPEYCTPETSNPLDLVIADRAGAQIVEEAARACPGVTIYKNNSDGQGNSFGCHENYLIQRLGSKEFEEKLTGTLLPFFVTRQLFTGSGKIGVEEEYSYGGGIGSYWKHFTSAFMGGNTKSTSRSWEAYKRKSERVLSEIESLGKYLADIPGYTDALAAVKNVLAKREELGEPFIYQLSQRADFFEQLIGLGTTQNRPIMNTRDEPHANREKYMRLHVINGDANLCEVATYLKVGTTALVLDLFEDGLAPSISLADPVQAFKNISADQKRKWEVSLEDKKRTSALDIQDLYLRAAEAAYRGRDNSTDEVLSRWRFTLEALASDPMQLVGQVDWVTKLHILSHLSNKQGVSMMHTTIKNAALQYHEVNRERGLFYTLERRGLIERLSSDEAVVHAMSNPPRDTRAFLRGKVQALEYVSNVDWGGFSAKAGGEMYGVRILEPFAGTAVSIEPLLTSASDANAFIESLRTDPGLNVVKRVPLVQKYFGKKRKGKNAKNAGLSQFSQSLPAYYQQTSFIPLHSQKKKTPPSNQSKGGTPQ